MDSETGLPRNWPKYVRSAITHAASLAHTAVIYTRSWCANSRLQRIRLSGKLEQARNEITLLREELRIKDIRMARISPHHRPFYPPAERMAILELKAARGWNLAQAAEAMQVEPETVASWLRRVDEEGEMALVRIPEAINKFPDFVRHIVKRLKVLCPIMGRKKIADILARAGLHLGATTVRRFLKTGPADPPRLQVSGLILHPSDNRAVTSKYPNHVWHVDLTVVPTSAGFWTALFPFTLLQVWPFCWWVAVIMDHFSRKALGFAVYRKQPTSREVCSFLGRATNANSAKPKHIINDRGKQFDCQEYRNWAKGKKIRLRYGAVGKYGSIAVIERFIRSMKDEFTNRIIMPLNLDEARHEIGLYATWYNHFRPHEFLKGRTPEEVYAQSPPLEATPAGPNSELPEMKMKVSWLEQRKQLPIVKLLKAA